MREGADNTSYSAHKSLRLSDYDYASSGIYSVTICTRKRKPLFTRFVLRNILREQWERLPQHFAGAKPGLLMIMPDHIHCLIQIDGDSKEPSTLGDMIQGYKSLTTVEWIRSLLREGKRGEGKIWQRSFHDHIIRNEADLKEKRQYILNNPVVWNLKMEQKGCSTCLPFS